MALSDALKELEKVSKTSKVATSVKGTYKPKPKVVPPLMSKSTPIKAQEVEGFKPVEKQAVSTLPIYDPRRGPIIPTFKPAEALAKKFLGSATLGLSDILTGQLQKGRTAELEEESKKMPVASTVAQVAGYIPSGAGIAASKLVRPLVGKATEKAVTTAIGKKLGEKATKAVVEGAIVGTGMTATEDIARGRVKELPKDVLVGAVLGAGADIGLTKLSTLAKPILTKIKSGITLSQAEKVAAAKQMNVPVEDVDTVIQRELGLPKETTAQDFMRQQEQVAKDIQAEQYSKSFEKAPDQLMNDFTEWRKKNFGGAYGKMTNADNKALKQLYKEDTGIDLDEEINNALRNMQNRAIGVEPTRPLKPVQPSLIRPLVPRTPIAVEEPSLVKPLVSEEPKSTVVSKSVEQVKTTEKKVFDSELQTKLNELDARYNEDLARYKKMTNKELASQNIKRIGFERAAEKRRLIQGDSFEQVQGGLTPKELSEKIRKEKTNYVGKSVITPEGEGKVIGQSFGKVGVEFEDGTKRYFVADDIQPKTKPYEKQAEVIYKEPTPQVTEQPTSLVKPLVGENVQAKEEGLKTPFKDVETPTQETRFKPEEPAPEGMKYSKANVTFANAPVTGDELVKKINADPIKYQPTTREAQVKAAKEIADNDFEAAVKMVREGDRFKSDIENAVGLEVFSKLQQQGRYDESFEIMEALSRKGTKAGQQIESFKIWSKSTPEGMQRFAIKTLEDSGTKVDGKFIAEVGDRMREIQRTADVDELKSIVESKIKSKAEKKLFGIASQSESAERLREMANMQIIGDVFKKIKPEKLQEITVAQGRKLSSLQAIDQLLSLVTFQRNLYGNALNLFAENVAKYPATLADIAASKITKQRTISAKSAPSKLSYAQGISQAKRSLQEIMAGVQVNSGDKQDLIMQPAFANVPILREMEKALSFSLSTPDEFFKGMVTADSMYNQLRARIGKAADKMLLDEIKKAVTPKEFETALAESRFATFQNDSLPSKLLTGLKRELNRIGYGGEALGVKEFGAGDLIIKYTKVPGNIIARGVEFSPLGYTKALAKMLEMNKNPSAQRQFAQSFGRATTGTGMLGLGTMLYNSGVIVGEDTDLKPRERALLRAEGKSGYKINVNALTRLINGESPDIRKGDKLISFDAIQPIATPIMVGASTAEKLQQGGITKRQAIGQISEKTMEEVLDLPSLYVLNQIYSETKKEDFQPTDVARVVMSEAIPGFVPAILRQSAQSTDDVIRETKGKDVTETMVNKIKSQIPVVSKTLEPKIQPTGTEAKRIGGITPFIDPFKTTEYKPTGYTDKLQAIKKVSGETKQFSTSYAPKTITIRNEKVELTPQEKTLYMRTLGSYVDERYQSILSNVNVSDLSVIEAKRLAERLANVQDSARKKAVQAIINSRR